MTDDQLEIVGLAVYNRRMKSTLTLKKWMSEFHANYKRPYLEEAQAAIEAMQGDYCGCMCDACRPHAHDSDCAVHNEPATAMGACDCSATPYPTPPKRDK